MTECAFGAEISEDRSSCAVAKAWRFDAARVAVKLVWHGPPAVATDVLDALYMSDEPAVVVVDPKSQSATLCSSLAERGIEVKRLAAEEVAVAHGEFMDAVSGGSLKHFGQAELTEAVRAAQQRGLAGANALDRRAGSDLSSLNASEFAVHSFRAWEKESNPGAWEM